MLNKAERKIVLFKYLLIFFGLILASHNAISQVNIDSLKRVIPNLKGREKLDAIEHLSFWLQYKDKDAYYEYSKLGFEQALADHDSSYVAIFLIELGYYYKSSGNYQKSLNEFTRAEKIALSKNLKKQLIKVYTALGTVYYDLGLYDKALQNHTKSLLLKEELGNRSQFGVSFNNLGLIYYKLDDPKKAIEYFDKALEIKLEFGDTASSISTYINIGLAYAESSIDGSLISAKSNFKKAIKLSKKYGQLYQMGFSYNGLAKVFAEQMEYDSAKYYLNLSNVESFKNDYKNLESSNYYLLSKIAFQDGKYDLAINYLERSQGLLVELKDKYRIKNNYGLFAEIYEMKNMLDSAFFYQKRYTAMKDSIFDEELAQNLANVQIAAIEEQSQKTIADQEEKISQSKFFSLFLLSILALSIALIVVIFRNYSQTSKINRQLNESKNKIQAQKENLEKKNDQLADAQITIKNQNEVLKNINVDLDKKVKERTQELNKSNYELEKAVKDLDQFIYKTSHDLRGPIATMQGIINLGVMDSIDEKAKEYFNTLHKVSTNLNNVLFRLIEVHETYQKKPILEYLDPLQEIIDTSNRVSQFTIEPDITIVTELQANGQWNSDKVLFNLIIENMLRNAILYRDRGESIIKVSTEYKNNQLFIVIEDNGFGVQQGDEDKVFNIFFKGSPRPGGTGLEVYTSKIAVEKLGGSISLRKPMKNTIFEIVLPLIEN